MADQLPPGFMRFAVKFFLFACGLCAVTVVVFWLALGPLYGIVLLIVGGSAMLVGSLIGITGIAERASRDRASEHR